ncbi:hypothetical protein [Oceanibium sediminis]|uniref:hypothetical protein n=1 Tax=Oceanibium sediminis TaxID=2026339 RepID=UPI000DD41B37|nr:hypothetical protein [Oceanibium sediminis]
MRIRPGTQGLIWCLVFVFLDSVQAVYFGSILQGIDGFLLGGLVFGISSVFCLGWSVLRSPEPLRRVEQNLPSVIGLNVTAAGGWLFYLLAVQLIEPAVAFTIFAGSVPLVTIVAAWSGVPEGQVPRNAAEVLGNLGLALGLLVLAGITVLGLSGFVRGDALVGAQGVALALLGGIFITGMLLYGQRLDRVGVDPVTQFAVRFPLFLVLSGLGVLLGIDAKGPVAIGELARAVGIGLLVLAFPIYAVQKAISLTNALTIGALAGTAPLVVFVLQMIEGRVETSAFTTVGLVICFLGAVTGAFGAAAAKEGKPPRPRRSGGRAA